LTASERSVIISTVDIASVDITMPTVEEFLPLTPIEFHMLAALAGAARHGYGIMQEVQERSDGAVRIGAGTLYTALKRMLDDGLVRELESAGGADDANDRRRTYTLTSFGQSVLRADAKRLEQLVLYAREKKILSGRARS
jgi:DNA-binding PadR family transcriptional regulator